MPEFTEAVKEYLRKHSQDMPNWKCPKCGESPRMDGNWRFNGRAWEHYHGYPLGHILAEKKRG